jgi:hypothetical protein
VRLLGEWNPAYQSHLRRLLLFREANAVVDFTPVIRHVPNLVDLTLFGWEFISVEPASWRRLSRQLVSIELVGLGFNATAVDGHAERGNSATFDVTLLSEATLLQRFRLAGWGDTTLELNQLLETLTGLESLYLEDVKIGLQKGGEVGGMRRKRRRGGEHGLTSLNICHCSTSQVQYRDVIDYRYVLFISVFPV